MQAIRKNIVEAIRAHRLPLNPGALFGELYSEASETFPIQESLHWDFKENFPPKYDGDYFGGIMRLICAFYNTVDVQSPSA